MEIIGVSAEANGGPMSTATQVQHDIWVCLAEIAEIVHQGCHENEVDVAVVMNAKIEINKLLDVALAMAIRVEYDKAP